MREKGNRGYKKGKSATTIKNLSDDTSTKERKPNSHRFNGRRFYCDKIGHRATDCRQKKNGGKANQAREESEAVVALSAMAFSADNDEWYLAVARLRICVDHVTYSFQCQTHA